MNLSRADIVITLLAICTICLVYIAWAAEKALDYLHEIAATIRQRDR